MPVDTKNVRVEEKTIARVKKVILTTKQTLGGFFTLAAEEKIKNEVLKDKIRRIAPYGVEMTTDDMVQFINKVSELVK